ncbi:MAG: hypothetical protein F6J98_05760 [Moorea sp. SIO4G2]|nr:hypothetical protein [Moorena sp. SIO4G2]
MKIFVTKSLGSRESGVGSRESGIGSRESGVGSRAIILDYIKFFWSGFVISSR